MKNQEEIIKKVATGLRKMDIKPKAFLFFDSEDFFFDMEMIMGFPVYRTEFIYQGNGQEQIPFYPIFSDAHKNYTLQVSLFRRGYEDA